MFDFARKKPISPAVNQSNPAAKSPGPEPEKVKEIDKVEVEPKADLPASEPVGKLEISSFSKVINFCFYAIVLVTPLLFSSFTSEFREFGKQNFVFFLVAISLGIWLLKILTTRRLSWVKTSLDFILLAYLGVYLATSLVSIDKPSSFLGYYGRFTGSFVSVACFVVLYFLLTNNVRSPKTANRIINYLWVGMGIVLAYSLLQIFGVFVLPLPFTHNNAFNPIGSQAALAIFAAISLIFFQCLLFARKQSRLNNWILGILTIMGLGILLLINAFIAWLVLALGMIAFLAIAMSSKSEASSGNWIWKPMLVLVVAMVFVAFQFLPQIINPRNLTKARLPVEVQLSNSATWNLVKNSFSGGAKEVILGSGPGTTGIAFGEIKPADLNRTIVWNLNFDRASTEIANILIETGILGFLAFELTGLLFLFFALYFLLKKRENNDWMSALVFFMIWLALYITHFFYFFNTTFYLLYWVSLGVFMAIVSWNIQEAASSRDISLAFSARTALPWMFVSLLVFGGLLVAVFFQAAVLAGELAYALGVTELRSANPDLVKSEKELIRAKVLNPYRDIYFLTYGQNLILQARKEAAKPTPNVEQIKVFMADLINAGQKAAALSPNKSSNWSTLAQFYTNIKPLASGADKFIIESLQKAIERDPKNPALHYQLGQAYSVASEVIDQQLAKKAGIDTTKQLTNAQLSQITKIDPDAIKNAVDELKKAIELKSDLPQFYIQLGRTYEKAGQVDEAKVLFDSAANIFPNNTDVLFEQGRITFNQQKIDDAEKIFLAVLAINPDYANARYSLGRIYQQKGDNVKALVEYEKVSQIVGPNAELDKLIETLRTSKKR